MNKMLKNVFFLSVMLLSVSCNNESVSSKSVNVAEQQNNDIVSIEYSDIMNEPITDFYANVKEYSFNDRKIGSFKNVAEYRINLKRINDKKVYRMESIALEGVNDKPVTTIYDGVNLISFYTGTSQVLFKQPYSTPAGMNTFENRNVIASRVDLKGIVEQYRKINCDIIEDKNKKQVSISFPANSILLKSLGSNISSYKLVYDLVENVLQETEMIMQDSEFELTKTIKGVSFYTDVNGVKILTAEVMSVKKDYKNNVDVSDSTAPVINDPSEIQEINQDDLQGIIDNGGIVVEQDEPLLGDPADADNTDYFLRVYEDINLEEVDKNLFKITL